MHQHPDRMPPLKLEEMDAAQKTAAEALIAGPRKAVKGPFIALLRSPLLMDRLQRVGEYIRFDSSLPPRISEFTMCVVSRVCTQQFEWFTHVPLAMKEGTSGETIEALRCGRRPNDMHADEALVYDFTQELMAHHGVCDATYAAAVERFGERGVIDLTGLIGYFITVSLVLNVAHTPPEVKDGVAALPALPL
ncbi:MAG: carboxymuconolactone decarboxylase family protein [Candidatus Afipia apatlaquensis]|uniref:Carboxymuconolactone decarboxylase family protein n=1 Tax=Candidatus Afipia apatlaquensis TaxID=2712852 RepID=A0A7C9RKF2_9BRAD|nr:carboxymuconolactone decarboxylase family protein [Candidatus Afipia apatlaquensis]